MTKKNEKRLCWNCDGSVSQHLAICPYCGVDLSAKPDPSKSASPFKGFASVQAKSPFEMAVSEEEWKKALEEEKEEGSAEAKEGVESSKKEMSALLLLLPGIVFLLFGLALMLFAHDGVVSLRWNKNLAYFYLAGAAPLIYLGWKVFK